MYSWFGHVEKIAYVRLTEQMYVVNVDGCWLVQEIRHSVLYLPRKGFSVKIFFNVRYQFFHVIKNIVFIFYNLFF